MIINPSAHTVIPRKNTPFRTANRRGSRRRMTVPGGKHFFVAAVKMCLASAFFLLLSSLWLSSSISEVEEQIAKMETQREQLVNSNILMRAKKANMFSPETVEEMAGDQFAIHLPQSGQYKFIQ